MNTIRILPESVAIQIAAGEVIERPASVVRELLDNSIDAQSDKIQITIEEGGRKLIRVSDNGVGMGKDDLLLSLERHATSKIHWLSDLDSVKTLGFRGEALPSIASVSRMEIISRPANQLIGYKVVITGGKLESIDETGAPVGTTVVVKDLFFNIPARRKFLRSAKTETNHIVDIISRIILPFIQIQLHIEIDGKVPLHFPMTRKVRDRLSVIMGSNMARTLIEEHKERDALKISAYLSTPEESRNRGDRIFIYVNGRHIRDRLVTRALMEGYGQRLMKGRYPQAVIFLDMDPSAVDVNVHPTKQEIRFRDGQYIYQTITSWVEKSLRAQFHSFSTLDTQQREEPKSWPFFRPTVAEPAWEYSRDESIQENHHQALYHPKILAEERIQVIGQLKNTYILCQTREGLLLLDQHAAHERIVYETLRKTYASSRVESQAFLIPQQLEFSLKETQTVIAKVHQLENLGLFVEHFGGQTFLVRSIPSMLVNTEWEQFFRDLVPILETEEDLSSDDALDKLWTVMACHSAVRAGQVMSHQEMDRLVEQLEQMDLPTNCPHGRPVFKMFTFGEIEKMFKRVI
ncbi:MAG: DNA mismatch repair endonuclease MutL [Deltaproteobacteria bacterium]|nr:DNA mismatch repair endonuclease MutL [Deltaproteobacteria bacterium]